jgi:hypothetical protein
MGQAQVEEDRGELLLPEDGLVLPDGLLVLACGRILLAQQKAEPEVLGLGPDGALVTSETGLRRGQTQEGGEQEQTHPGEQGAEEGSLGSLPDGSSSAA